MNVLISPFASDSFQLNFRFFLYTQIPVPLHSVFLLGVNGFRVYFLNSSI